jgi:ribosomal protein S18 acetylase RimI-like enzyme
MKNEPIIQRAEPGDALSLAELAETTFRGAFAKLNDRENFEKYVACSFTERRIRSEILDPAVTFFIAKLDDRWVGYAKLKQGVPPDCVRQTPSIEISRLYCTQEYLGCGIGPALMQACINHARKKGFKSVWLSSWKKNSRGNAFYSKMQFEIIGSTTFALGPDIQDDWIFSKSII